jgi:hypothetical protein
MDRFSPEKENFAYAPVWIRLYSLPQEFWLEEILAGIGNTLGRHVKSSEATKQRKYTSYARICVYMDISKSLPGTVTLEYQDEEWAQTIDYKHIPFHCRKCHEHGHLFRDFPLNAPTKPEMEEKMKEGFTQVQNRKNQAQKKTHQGGGRKNSNANSFDTLNHLPEVEEIENPHLSADGGNIKSKEKQQKQPRVEQKINPESQPPLIPGKSPVMDEDTTMELNEQELADIDLDKLEEALNKKDLQTIPDDQLRKFHKVFLDSTAGATSRLGIGVDPNPDPRKIPKENKRRGQKSAQQLIKEAGNYMINSGQIQRLSEGSFSHPPNC